MIDLLGLQERAFTLNATQLVVRSVVVYFATIAFVRISGMRTFGFKTAFDAVICIMLGALLSRAIVAISPFFPTLLVGLALSGLHRLLAYLSLHNEKLGNLVKGEQRLLVKEGELMRDNLARSNISEKDLMGSIRKSGHDSLAEVKRAYMERSGEISVVPYQHEKK